MRRQAGGRPLPLPPLPLPSPPLPPRAVPPPPLQSSHDASLQRGAVSCCGCAAACYASCTRLRRFLARPRRGMPKRRAWACWSLERARALGELYFRALCHYRLCLLALCLRLLCNLHMMPACRGGQAGEGWAEGRGEERASAAPTIGRSHAAPACIGGQAGEGWAEGRGEERASAAPTIGRSHAVPACRGGQAGEGWAEGRGEERASAAPTIGRSHAAPACKGGQAGEGWAEGRATNPISRHQWRVWLRRSLITPATIPHLHATWSC